MVNVEFTQKFLKQWKQIDPQVRYRLKKLIAKLTYNPELGKPMRYSRKGTRALRVPPFRLAYVIKDDIWLLELYHKDEQ